LKLHSPLGSHDTEPSSEINLESFDVYVELGSEGLNFGTGSGVVATVEDVDEFGGGEAVEELVGRGRVAEVGDGWEGDSIGCAGLEEGFEG